MRTITYEQARVERGTWTLSRLHYRDDNARWVNALYRQHDAEKSWPIFLAMCYG